MTECFACGALRHAACLLPPQKHLPYGDWFCPDCALEPIDDLLLLPPSSLPSSSSLPPSSSIKGCRRRKPPLAASRFGTRQAGREGGREGWKMGASGAVQQQKKVDRRKGGREGGKEGGKVPGVEELFASFGFEDGEEYTLEEYEEMASEWKKEYFKKVKEGREGEMMMGREGGKEGGKVSSAMHSSAGGMKGGRKEGGKEGGEEEEEEPGEEEEEEEPTEEEVEREFWRLMGGGEAAKGKDEEKEEEGGREGGRGRSRAPTEVKVEYGSEIDTGVYGSAFPLPASLRTSSSSSSLPSSARYARSGWNINNLPVATGSMLHHLDVPITGVVVPWLYVGMALSAFCWHAEDHYLYSINYLHLGKGAKQWYGLPGREGERFEGMVQKEFPELLERNPDLMLQLVTMVDPTWIASKGLPVYTTKQRAGTSYWCSLY